MAYLQYFALQNITLIITVKMYLLKYTNNVKTMFQYVHVNKGQDNAEISTLGLPIGMVAHPADSSSPSW